MSLFLNRKPLLRLICFLVGLLSTLVFAFGFKPASGVATQTSSGTFAASEVVSYSNQADWYAVNNSHREPNFYQ